jgi:hypothetical protein
MKRLWRLFPAFIAYLPVGCAMFEGRKFYVLPRNMGPMDLQILKAHIRQNGGMLCTAPDSDIQIVIAKKTGTPSDFHEVMNKCQQACIVSSEWLVECVRQSRMIDSDLYQLHDAKSTIKPEDSHQESGKPSEHGQKISDSSSGPPVTSAKRSRTEASSTAIVRSDTATNPNPVPEPPRGGGHDPSLDLANPSSDWAGAADWPLPAVPTYRPASSRPPTRWTPDGRSALLHMVPSLPSASSAAARILQIRLVFVNPDMWFFTAALCFRLLALLALERRF